MIESGLALLLLFSGSASAANYDLPPLLTTTEQFKGARAAFEFCFWQQRAFEIAREQHPDMAQTAMLVEQQFHERTGDGCGSLDRLWQRSAEAIEPGKWPSVRATLFEKAMPAIQDNLDELSDRSVAEQFIEQVRGGSEGKLDAAIASQLVRASEGFRKRPSDLWPRWTHTWDSATSPDAQGLAVRVRVPLSFAEAGPNGKNMLQKWTLPLEIDRTHVMLNVSHNTFSIGDSLLRAVAAFEQGSRKQWGAYLDGIAADMTLLSSKRVTALGRPALMLEIEADGSPTGRLGRLRTHMLIALVPTGYVSSACVVAVPKGQLAQLDILADRYAPLCLAFLSSLTDASQP